MRLAIELGVSPRRLWGWEPATRILPDGDGWRLEREPEFDADDVAVMRACRALDEATSPNGFLYADEISPLADPFNPDRTHEFVADENPTVNYAERARALARKQWMERAGEDVDTSGYVWRVHKRTIRDTDD